MQLKQYAHKASFSLVASEETSLSLSLPTLVGVQFIRRNALPPFFHTSPSTTNHSLPCQTLASLIRTWQLWEQNPMCLTSRPLSRFFFNNKDLPFFTVLSRNRHKCFSQFLLSSNNDGTLELNHHFFRQTGIPKKKISGILQQQVLAFVLTWCVYVLFDFIVRKTFTLQVKTVTGNFAVGHFAVGNYAVGYFAVWKICRKENSPKGNFAVSKFRRKEFSP